MGKVSSAQRMLPEHFDGVVALQRLCFPDPFPTEFLWTQAHLQAHHEKFPEGQFVVLSHDQVVASASSCRISEASWQAHKSWEQTLGGFTFENFDPHGKTLYGADISVHPDFRGQGLGRILYEARFDLVRRLGMARFGTACRLPDFSASGFESPAEFARQVAGGQATDRTLTPLLRYGMRMAEVLENYMDDAESGNAAALLEWTPPQKQK